MTMTINPVSCVNAQNLRGLNSKRQNVQFKGCNPKNVCNLVKQGLANSKEHLFINSVTLVFGVLNGGSLSTLVGSKIGADIVEVIAHGFKYAPGAEGAYHRFMFPHPLTFKYSPTNTLVIVRSVGNRVLKLVKKSA